MLEVEVLGADLAPDAPPLAQVRRLCVLAAASAGVEDGHLAIEYVDAERIAELNVEHRGKDGDDGNDHQQFNQSESAFLADRCH